MFQKLNRFYADWRDADGKRHRKAFVSAALAYAYEDAARGTSTPPPVKAAKKATAQGKVPSPASSRRSPSRPVRVKLSALDKTTQPPKRSSSTPGTSRRRPSLRRKSTRS